MNYLLKDILSSDDIEWLNNTELLFDIIDYKTGATLDDTDSGWCDMAAQARMISPQERIVFHKVTDEQLTLISLRFGNRLKELQGVRRIYNIQ